MTKRKFNIVLDAGHGGEDSGAVGMACAVTKNTNLGVETTLSNPIYEKDVNLAVAKYTRRYLNTYYPNNFNCYMTRTSDTFITLPDRVINGVVPDLYISIHCNSFDEVDDTVLGVTGIETFYYWDDAKRFANILQRNIMNRFIHSKNRGVKHARYYVIRKSVPESVLFECEFIDEKAEWLSQEQIQRDYGIIIGESVREYFLC